MESAIPSANEMGADVTHHGHDEGNDAAATTSDAISSVPAHGAAAATAAQQPVDAIPSSLPNHQEEDEELVVVDYVTDDAPSAFLRCTMSRRISESLVTEPRLRPFLLQLLSTAPVQDTTHDTDHGVIEDAAIRGIYYGKSARRVILLALRDVAHAVYLREILHGKPCDLLHGRVMYVEFALHRKHKEARDAFDRVANISRIRALEDPSQRIPGLLLLPEFITREQECRLLAYFDRKDRSHWANTVKARQVQHFGYEFDYEARRCHADQPLVVADDDNEEDEDNDDDDDGKAAMPPLMRALTRAIPRTVMADEPDQITVNEYLPGQGIAAHIDTHSAFTEAIASLSLAHEIVMEFRHPDGRCESVLLQPRSLLVMTRAARYEWTHAIPPRTFDVVDGQRVDRQRRVSITFRKVQTTPCTCDFPVQCDVDHSLSSTPAKNGDGDGDGEEARTTLAPTLVEQQYVHAFYETVAGHFSSTRYNPWPRVEAFVRALPAGSWIADIGCGNGKYLKCVDASQSLVVGGDRSASLIELCRASSSSSSSVALAAAAAALNVMVCDAMAVPIRSQCCDAALSIAVLHHLSTLHHRVAAVKEVIRVLRVGGRGIIYAWAHEQKRDSRRQFDADRQDFMVPWNLDERFAKAKAKAKSKPQAKAKAKTTAKAGECKDGTLLVDDEEEDRQEEEKEEEEEERTDTGAGTNASPIVVQRYCHMFKQGELEALVEAAGNAVVEESYYDESNWAIVLRRVS